MANKPLRIPIPTTTADLLKLGGAIYAKHQADGAASPLKAMEDYNWDDIGPRLAIAQNLHNQAEEFRKKAEALYRERDLEMPGIKGAVTSSRNILKGMYAKNPKKMGEHGFTVDDTPKAKAAPAGE